MPGEVKISSVAKVPVHVRLCSPLRQSEPCPRRCAGPMAVVCSAAALVGIMALALIFVPPAASFQQSRQERPATTSQIVYQQGVSPSPDYDGAADTFISRLGDEAANYGSEEVLALASGDQRAALLRFELAGLTADVTVTQATLSLYVEAHPEGTGIVPVTIYRVLRAWAADEATWFNATNADLWTLAGCNGPGSDRVGAPTSSGTLTASGTWVDLDVTALAQAWLADPAANYGLILKTGGLPGDEYHLRSAESSALPSTRPRLTVVYGPFSPDTPTPTPTIAYGVPVAVTFQQGVSPAPDYIGAADTFISDYGDLNANYGADGALRLRSNDHRASLLRFDLTSLPTYAAVYSATLSLYSQSRTNISPLSVGAYQVLRPWVENESTWYLAATGNRWAFPGCNGLSTDRMNTPVATTTVAAVASWFAFDLTYLVRAWVADAETNSGVIIKTASGPQVEYALVSGDYLSVPNLRPKLHVLYSLPINFTPVPTPSRTPTATASITPTPSVVPTVVVFQRGEQPDTTYQQVEDTFISNEGDPTSNYGREPVLTIGSNDTRAALIRFDLTRVPYYATVLSAKLALFSSGATIGHPGTFSVFGMVRPWSASAATWFSATTGARWTVSGANGLGSDRMTAPTDTRSVSTLGDWYEFDVTNLVALWVAFPEDNTGLVLKGMPGPQVDYDFLSSDHQIGLRGTFRPKLTVAYTVPTGPTPTPPNTRTPTATATRWWVHLPLVLSVYSPPGTPTPSVTGTPIPKPTGTQTPSATTVPSPTATMEPVATGTVTRTPTASPTPVATPTPTRTATPSATPTRTPIAVVFRQGISPSPGYDGVWDTHISNYDPGDATTNFATNTTLWLRSTGHRVALMRFDISSIPVTATILQASLSLYVDSQTNSNPLAVSAYRLLRSWSLTQTTWLLASAGTPWGFPGANAIGTDREDTPTGTQTLTQAHVWYELNLKPLVQSWVANPGGNHGFVLIGSSSGGQVEYHLRSSDYYSAPEFRPKLVVTYIP